jgi:hypothetical protein
MSEHSIDRGRCGAGEAGIGEVGAKRLLAYEKGESLRSVPSWHSHSNSASYRRFAAFLVRLAGGNAATVEGWLSVDEELDGDAGGIEGAPGSNHPESVGSPGAPSAEAV